MGGGFLEEEVEGVHTDISAMTSTSMQSSVIASGKTSRHSSWRRDPASADEVFSPVIFWEKLRIGVRQWGGTQTHDRGVADRTVVRVVRLVMQRDVDGHDRKRSNQVLAESPRKRIRLFTSVLMSKAG